MAMCGRRPKSQLANPGPTLVLIPRKYRMPCAFFRILPHFDIETQARPGEPQDRGSTAQTRNRSAFLCIDLVHWSTHRKSPQLRRCLEPARASFYSVDTHKNTNLMVWRAHQKLIRIGSPDALRRTGSHRLIRHNQRSLFLPLLPSLSPSLSPPLSLFTTCICGHSLASPCFKQAFLPLPAPRSARRRLGRGGQGQHTGPGGRWG